VRKKPVIRTCCGCRKKGEKAGFIRVVLTPDERIVADLSQKISGRGIYFCRNRSCIEKALKSRAVRRSFRGIDLPEEIADLIMKECL